MSTDAFQKIPTAWHYVWQIGAVFIFLCVVLVMFYSVAKSDVLWAVGASSLASSAYIVFSKPQGATARPARFMLAYVIAILCGMFMHFLGRWLFPEQVISIVETFFTVAFFAALAVSLALLLMLLFRAEHPPAAGMALVFVVDVRDYRTAIIAIAAVAILALLRVCLDRWLCDLF